MGSKGKPGMPSMPWRWPMVRLIVLRAPEWAATTSPSPSPSGCFLERLPTGFGFGYGLTFPCRIPNTPGTDYPNAAR